MIKKILIAVFFLSLVTYCTDKQVKKTEPDPGVLKYIPASTMGILKVSSMAKVAETFLSNDEISRDVKAVGAKFKKDFGINLLDPISLYKKGVDLKKEAGVFVSDLRVANQVNGRNSIIINFFVPTVDGEKTINFLKDSIIKIGEKQPEDIKIGWEIVDNRHLLTGAQSDDTTVLIYQKGDFVFLSVAKNYKRTEVLNLLNNQTTIYDTPELKKVLSRVDPSEDIWVFGRFSKDMRNPILMRMIPWHFRKAYGELQVFQSIAYNVDLDSKDLNVNFATYMADRPEKLKEYIFDYDKNDFLKVNRKPVMTFTLGGNVSAIYENLLKSNDRDTNRVIQAIREGLQEKLKISLEDEVIGNLNGSINLGFFDGENISAFNTNSVVTISIKDEARMKKTLGKIFSALPAEIEVAKTDIGGMPVGVLRSRFVKIYFLVRNENLILATNNMIIGDILSGSIEKGFTSKMPANIAPKVKGDYHTFYLNIDEGMKAVRNLISNTPYLRRELVKFEVLLTDMDYIFASSKLDGREFYGDFKIATSYKKPFFITFIDTLVKFRGIR